MNRKTFTLIELLIGIFILTSIIGLIISIIKPTEIYKKARDNQRIVDLNFLESNIKSYLLLANTSSIYATSTLNRVFLSLVLPSFATNTNCKNYFPTLPDLPSGWEYVCSKTPTSTDGTGWIPIDFRNYMIYTITNLPLDPLNNSNYYYAFIANDTKFVLYTQLEDSKNPASKNDNDNYPYLYSTGPNKRLLDQAQGLVGYWPFDEGTETIAYDYSGNGNNGTLLDASPTNADGNTPPQWTTGKIGGALSFDGVDDYVDTLLIFNSPSRFTVIAWINLPITQGTQKNIAGTSYRHPQLLILGGNLVRIQFGDLTGFPGVNSTISIPNNEWHHVVGTWNGITLRIYIDGVLNNTYNPGSSPINNTQYHFQIGAFGPPNSNLRQLIQGLIDEVRIYNRALSDSEIKVLYEATK